MMAKHRYTARNPIDIEVQILFHGRRFFAARGRSLSKQGMYLDVHNVTLPVGTQVELEMECLGKRWRLEAMVVHRSPAGVGVKFCQTQPELGDAFAPGLDATRRDSPPAMPPPQTLGLAAPASGVAPTGPRD